MVARRVGGTTTIIDYAEQTKGGTLTQAVQASRAKADPKAGTHHGLHVSITDARSDALDEMSELAEAGESQASSASFATRTC